MLVPRRALEARGGMAKATGKARQMTALLREPKALLGQANDIK